MSQPLHPVLVLQEHLTGTGLSAGDHVYLSGHGSYEGACFFCGAEVEGSDIECIATDSPYAPVCRDCVADCSEWLLAFRVAVDAWQAALSAPTASDPSSQEPHSNGATTP